MATLIDTSALLAYSSAKDAYHEKAKQLFRSLRNEQRFVPASVMSELFYMVHVRLNYSSAVRVFTTTQNAFTVLPLIDEDMERMQQIMTKYADVEFDYTDVSIMALAERLNIQRICTFDYTDFSIYQPAHCSHFELLP
jgi:predicted nucleic acid-binding protein